MADHILTGTLVDRKIMTGHAASTPATLPAAKNLPGNVIMKGWDLTEHRCHMMVIVRRASLM